MNLSLVLLRLAAAGLVLSSHVVHAKASPEQVAQLGGETLTCFGAERAASPGGVAAYSGQWLGQWPGLKNTAGYDPGPYAAEKPLFTISAENMAQYDSQLTAGQKALLQKYKKGFRMMVYPSHRDFRYPDWMCDVAKQNAHSAEVIDGGLGARQVLGAIGFPFPTNGLEALYNIKKGSYPGSLKVVHSTAYVYGNNTIAWAKVAMRLLLPWAMPGLQKRPTTEEEPIEAYFLHEQILPERDRGKNAVGSAPNHYGREQLRAWVYFPGLRRVKQAVEVTPDFPVPPAGLHTVDDEHLFNGTPDLYSWKLVGKKEIYVPYNNFRINDPALSYAELIKPNSINPEYMRYELHRVWVVEGTLKPGVRHIYSRRVLYADEDTWMPLWSDNYDLRGQLWRANFINYFYSPVAQVYVSGVTLYHDLTAESYEAAYLVNESGDGWWKFNEAYTPDMFTTSALMRLSH
jgi:hypothetical protein